MVSLVEVNALEILQTVQIHYVLVMIDAMFCFMLYAYSNFFQRWHTNARVENEYCSFLMFYYISVLDIYLVKITAKNEKQNFKYLRLKKNKRWP